MTGAVIAIEASDKSVATVADGVAHVEVAGALWLAVVPP